MNLVPVQKRFPDKPVYEQKMDGKHRLFVEEIHSKVMQPGWKIKDGKIFRPAVLADLVGFHAKCTEDGWWVIKREFDIKRDREFYLVQMGPLNPHQEYLRGKTVSVTDMKLTYEQAMEKAINRFEAELPKPS